MPELRKDYVTDTWVVFSVIRSQRPTDFEATPLGRTSPERCPFCPGHEGMTPPEVFASRPEGDANGPGWDVRCVPNKYPALQAEGEVHRRVEQLFQRVNGVGAHEVIVETPDHDGHLPLLPEAQMGRILAAYKQRYEELSRDRRFKYVLLFKNHGERAGATISHPHSQLIATPIIPRRIMDEIRAWGNHHASTGGSCLFCEIVREEERVGDRIVGQNDAFVALVPYAARFPFETWILPREHEVTFASLPEGDRVPLARLLQDVLGRLYRLLHDPPYNYYIHTAPCNAREGRDFHWHMEITPRVTAVAGFERGTGFYINPVLPEDAARLLRQGGQAEA
jgi:UDPglucose--hexose-1-phosphate uridylyltransferase